MNTAARAPLLWASILVFFGACASEETGTRTPVQEPLFRSLTPEATRIDFRNTLSQHPSPHRNMLLYEYFSNGGGVAVGDVNGDGLDDLYFTGNMSYNALYLNRGSMEFEDVTPASGVAGRRDTWKTGAAMADVNGDGLLDIYVCYSGDLPLERRIDELYINQGADENGIPQFVEQAGEYGLANPHSSNQAYFFDYDRDGDLDLFLLTHNVRHMPRQDSEATQIDMQKEDPINGIRFYENRNGRFEDATRETGIQSSALTYGLGAGVSDVDRDGWMDVYVGNDYAPPDYLYINNGDGTFTDELKRRMGHTSNASMGVDIADINNDGWTDVAVLDMLAEDNRRQNLLFVPDDRNMFDMFVESGFHYQYMRNTLQLNNGDGTFSEIGQIAGVSNTDWSWTPLFADLDNDGLKDLFVSNGVLDDIINRDFLNYKNNLISARDSNLESNDVSHLLSILPSYDLDNYVFQNMDGLRFRDVSSEWGLDEPIISAGSVYSDLDNDGDLDLVTNNIDDYARIFENRSTDMSTNAYIRLDLRGDGRNTFGIGSKITVYTGEEKQFIEQMPTRGYLSSVSPTLHFGLGRQSRVDSVQVIWPDGRRQAVRGVEANQRITLNQQNADAGDGALFEEPVEEPVLEEAPSPIPFAHRMPDDIDDFRRQPLLVSPKSFRGPVLAGADVNGDGLLDVFAGGAAGQASTLFLQGRNGAFTAAAEPGFEDNRGSDDVDALFFDYNGDGHPDLYVAAGGYGRFASDDPALQDRLYVNDGDGSFSREVDALPEMRTSTGTVAATDINGDGWLDLFVGGHVVPGRYPEPPRSYILLNDGRGRFEDRTAEIAPELEHIGMVSDAQWHDLNGDGTDELIVVGEWMPIRVFENTGERLENRTERYFERSYSGLWNTVAVDDVNLDGAADIIAGNLGLNSQLKAGENQPAELYYADFDYDGDVDPILNYYIQGVSYPYVTLDELRDQMPRIGLRFTTNAAYSEARFEDIFSRREIEIAEKLEARYLETALFIGSENGTFERRDLPLQAQFSPVFTITTLDYNGDGNVDILLAGNMNEAPIRLGKYDANYGVLLRGDGEASFEYVTQVESGLSLRGDVRSVLRIDDMLLFGTNGRAIQAYTITPSRQSQLTSSSSRRE